MHLAQPDIPAGGRSSCLVQQDHVFGQTSNQDKQPWWHRYHRLLQSSGQIASTEGGITRPPQADFSPVQIFSFVSVQSDQHFCNCNLCAGGSAAESAISIIYFNRVRQKSGVSVFRMLHFQKSLPWSHHYLSRVLSSKTLTFWTLRKAIPAEQLCSSTPKHFRLTCLCSTQARRRKRRKPAVAFCKTWQQTKAL